MFSFILDINKKFGFIITNVNTKFEYLSKTKSHKYFPTNLLLTIICQYKYPYMAN